MIEAACFKPSFIPPRFGESALILRSERHASWLSDRVRSGGDKRAALFNWISGEPCRQALDVRTALLSCFESSEQGRSTYDHVRQTGGPKAPAARLLTADIADSIA